MIICADYHPSTCDRKDEFECRFARNTRRYMYSKAYDNWVNVNKLYGSDVCPLTKKPNIVKEEPKYENVFDTKTTLDQVTDALKRSNNDVIEKILDAHGLDTDYLIQHSEEFELEETTYPSMNDHETKCTLLHNGVPIGHWDILMSLDLDDLSIKGKVYYNIL